MFQTSIGISFSLYSAKSKRENYSKITKYNLISLPLPHPLLPQCLLITGATAGSPF